jgi:hypothetical protein
MTEHRPSFWDWSVCPTEPPKEILFMDAVKAGHIPIVGFTDEGLPIAMDTIHMREHPVTGCTAHEVMELAAL